jgi:hypothetical protein
MKKPLTREEEVRQITSFHGTQGPDAIYALLERQFAVLTSRAQILLGLCGIMITTTGFSGRMIAGTNPLAQVTIICAMATVLVAATVAVRGLLKLSWLTQFPASDHKEWLEMALEYRDRKTRLYDIATIVMTVGLTLYAVAIGLMLYSPAAYVAPINR